MRVLSMSDALDVLNYSALVSSYLKMVETRLYEAEAIIGVLQSLPVEGVQSVLREMGRDQLAGRVLERIAHTAFGPFGRGQHQENDGTRDSDEDPEGAPLPPFHTSPFLISKSH